jgi:Holliday junction resolvasome RuvABC endonuclease subunit
MILIGIDGSLTATGLVAIDLTGGGERVAWSECVRTKPDKSSRHLYQADEDGERVDAIARALLRLLEISGRAPLVACEAPAGSQHALSAKALGLVYGAVRGVLVCRGIAPIMVQAFEAKRVGGGSPQAAKAVVERAMRERFPSAFDTARSKPENEAIADAFAVACVALEHPLVRQVRS